MILQPTSLCVVRVRSKWRWNCMLSWCSSVVIDWRQLSLHWYVDPNRVDSTPRCLSNHRYRSNNNNPSAQAISAHRHLRHNGRLTTVSPTAVANLELYMYNRVVQSQFSHSAVVNRMESCSSLAAQAIGLKGWTPPQFLLQPLQNFCVKWYRYIVSRSKMKG